MEGLQLYQLSLRRLALFVGMLMSGGNFIFPRVPLLVLIIVLCIVVRGPAMGFRKPMFPLVLVLALVLVASLLAGGVNVEAVATRYANFLAALALLGLYSGKPKETLAVDLDFILRWMVPQAIFTVILAELFGDLFSSIVVNETPYRTVLWIFTYHVMLADSTVFFRPDGFFFEPGIFQIYLNIYLFLCLFVFKRIRMAFFAVLALLAVQSTAGLAICLGQVGLAYLMHLRRLKVSNTFVVAIMGIAALIPIAMFAYDNYQTKTSGVLRGSSWARQYDLVTGLRVIANNPIIGIGFDYQRYFEEADKVAYRETQLESWSIVERPNSNGIVTIFYMLGIPLGLLLLSGLFMQPFLPMKWLFGSFITLSLLSEAVAMTPFFLLFIFGGIMVIFSRFAARRPKVVRSIASPI